MAVSQDLQITLAELIRRNINIALLTDSSEASTGILHSGHEGV